MIKRLVKWGIFTFVLIMICIGVLNLFGKGPSELKDFLGVKEGGAISNVIDKAAGTNDYIADHKEEIGGFVNYKVINPVKQGIEDGTIKQGAQDLIDKAGNYAKENDLSGKAKNWFQGVADWFKNGMNWAAQNGSVLN